MADYPLTETYAPKALTLGGFPEIVEPGTILSGEGVLVAGTVMGRADLGAATAAAKAGGNTGDGVFTIDATTPVLAGAKAGVYTVTCITAAANGGTFRVEDPDGLVLGDVAVGATFADDIKFAIADGAADFIVGDGFTVTIAAGSGKWRKALAAAVDGSATPRGILAAPCDATDADVANVPIFKAGQFSSLRLIYGTGHTLTTVKAAFEGKPIFIATPVTV